MLREEKFDQHVMKLAFLILFFSIHILYSIPMASFFFVTGETPQKNVKFLASLWRKPVHQTYQHIVLNVTFFKLISVSTFHQPHPSPCVVEAPMTFIVSDFLIHSLATAWAATPQDSNQDPLQTHQDVCCWFFPRKLDPWFALGSTKLKKWFWI